MSALSRPGFLLADLGIYILGGKKSLHMSKIQRPDVCIRQNFEAWWHQHTLRNYVSETDGMVWNSVFVTDSATVNAFKNGLKRMQNKKMGFFMD